MKDQINRRLQITVIGDAEVDEVKYQLAYEVGEVIAKMGAVLITGGRGGVMEAASKGALDNKGLVVGILPGSFHSEANDYCQIVIPTGMSHSRNSLTVLAADIIIVIGGGAGTLSEMAFGWIYEKPIFALDNVDGWSRDLANKKIDHRGRDKIIGVSSIEMLKRQIGKFRVHLG